MSRFVIVGIEGNETLSLIDLQKGTVKSLDRSAVDPAILALREAGGTAIRGVDVAIAVEDNQDAVGRFFFDGGSAR